MSKHTPGPWSVQVEPHPIGGGMTEILISSERGEVAYFNTSSHAEYMADARLIAAAPELLDALQDLCSWEPLNQDKWDNARAAIAKATGEPA